MYIKEKYDFRDYRRGTVIRRLENRLNASGTGNYRNYLSFLDAHPEEYEKFAECVTIKVSGFFRTPYTFQQVVQRVFPVLVLEKRKHQERNLRVWCTSCAYGQEPYSVSMLLAEFLGTQRQDFNIFIYATDISRQALSEARSAIYSPREIEGISDTILEKYFNRSNGGYEVIDDIKQMLHFSYFDLTTTSRPPFMNLDLIFCCNFLIYLQKYLQEKVLNMLYDSLRSSGYLVLGEVETLPNSLRKKMMCLDEKAKIYVKN
ncbi:MAG: protein-glutamate O-methyltransferase CheR [Syntrophaceae bacterium]|nr:protein-glutamate O-methyltransferase CheR [Syntrophaceae bacterium]